MLAPFKQYFHQVALNSKYYTEDYFNTAGSKYKNNGFSIFHLNIHSLNKYHAELTTYISLLQIHFDCMCLSEIDTFNIDFCKHNFPNHTCHFDLPTSSNIGGVAIHMKKEHKVTEKSKYKIQSLGNAKVENVWYKITKGTKSYIVGAIYRHPSHNVKDFTEKLDNSLSLLTENRQIKNCIITGDLNIDFMKFDPHETTSDYQNTFLSHSFMSTSVVPT